MILLGFVGGLHVFARQFTPGQGAQPFQHDVHGIASDHGGRRKAHGDDSFDIGYAEQGAAQGREVIDGRQIRCLHGHAAHHGQLILGLGRVHLDMPCH